MILTHALRLAAEVQDLRQQNARLFAALCLANATTDRLAARCGQLQRDGELLALMARDRAVALEFIQTAHDIDNQDAS